ncbi:MAG: hypothetical protein H7X94_03640 [Vallitaleaceae bacterium]|nr:hypothetical protein [Vallitaleaceae bacterium]
MDFNHNKWGETMLDHEKVKLMTRLAIYEKNVGKDDLKKMDFFKPDYISFNNFKMQFSVTVALIFIFGIEFSKIVIDNIVDITDYNFVALGVKYLTIWVGLMVVYTIISTISIRLEYSKSKRRIDEYEKMLKNLEKIQ